MSQIVEIDVVELKNKIDLNSNIQIIDVREPVELAICKIQDTMHIPMKEIPAQIDKLNKKDELIILCRSGVRSAQVCEFLINNGFENVKNLKGGILEWVRLIDPSQPQY